MGHTSIKTTEVYILIDEKELMKIPNTLDILFNKNKEKEK